jgi:hypothetical protein
MAFGIAAAARKNDTAGIRQRRLLTLTGPALYATGGEAVTPQSLGLGVIEYIPDFWISDGTTALLAKFNYTTQKLMVFTGAGGTPAGTIVVTKPTFTVEAAGAIGTDMEVGLSADSAAATFEGGVGITAQRTLTTTSPVGTPTATFTGTAVAAGGFVEVANATVLTTFVGRVEVFGR